MRELLLRALAMISIWDMIIGGGYPEGASYFIIGICIFVISIIIALFTLPFLIYTLDKYYRLFKKIPLGPNGNIKKEKQHEFDYDRIIMIFLISDIFVLLLTIIMSAHGIYFLSDMLQYHDYLYKFTAKSNNKKSYVYVFPTPHYIVYVLQALFEAGQENLFFWGFLFLANYICKLINKPFYFKTFTFLLFIRVALAFVYNFNLWELLVYSRAQENLNLEAIGLAAHPFHTFAKSNRAFWLIYSLIVFTPFAVYLHRLVSRRLNDLTNEDANLIGDHQSDDSEDDDQVDFNQDPNVNDEKTQIKLVKRYLWLYIVFLVVNLLVAILECHFPNFAIQLAGNHENEVETVTESIIALSALSDILSFIPSFIFLFFITILGYKTAKNIVGEQDQDEDMPEQKYKRFLKIETYKRFFMVGAYKRFLMIGTIIFLFSFCCTGMIGYLRFSAGNFFQVILMPGDFIKLDKSKHTPYSSFYETCDTLEYSRTAPYLLTKFDLMSLFYRPEYYLYGNHCPNSTGLGFYNGWYQDPAEFAEQIEILFPDNIPIMWFPAGTNFSNFTIISNSKVSNNIEDWPLNFSYIHYPYPCYKDDNSDTPNTGLQIICSNYNQLKKNPLYLPCNTPNTTNSCCLEQDSIILDEIENSGNTRNQFSFIATRPNHKGKGNNLFDEIVKGKPLNEVPVSFISLKYHPNTEDYDDNHCTFFIICRNSRLWASLILVGIFLSITVYLCLSIIIISKLLSPYFI